LVGRWRSKLNAAIVDFSGVLPADGNSVSLGGPGVPSSQDISAFNRMIENTGGVSSSVKNFVNGAEAKLQETEMDISGKLRQFDAKDHTLKLIDAMHTSSLRSVSIQLTGKVGSKCSESFEQLIKQQ
jgi:hypothetical protein